MKSLFILYYSQCGAAHGAAQSPLAALLDAGHGFDHLVDDSRWLIVGLEQQVVEWRDSEGCLVVFCAKRQVETRVKQLTRHILVATKAMYHPRHIVGMRIVAPQLEHLLRGAHAVDDQGFARCSRNVYHLLHHLLLKVERSALERVEPRLAYRHHKIVLRHLLEALHLFLPVVAHVPGMNAHRVVLALCGLELIDINAYQRLLGAGVVAMEIGDDRRHRVVAVTAKGVAAQDALKAQPQALDGAVSLDSLHGIVAAGGMVTAHWGRERRNATLVELDGQYEQLLGYIGHTQFHFSMANFSPAIAVEILRSSSCMLRSMVE